MIPQNIFTTITGLENIISHSIISFSYVKELPVIEMECSLSIYDENIKLYITWEYKASSNFISICIEDLEKIKNITIKNDIYFFIEKTFNNNNKINSSYKKFKVEHWQEGDIILYQFNNFHNLDNKTYNLNYFVFHKHIKKLFKDIHSFELTDLEIERFYDVSYQSWIDHISKKQIDKYINSLIFFKNKITEDSFELFEIEHSI